MKRLMIAGTGSGSGKTTITCAVLQALVNRKMNVASFKCGPDYIDPMFHSRIIGAKSHNIDGWLCDEKTINYLIHKNSGDISVIESVMGFYDGVNGTASSRDISVSTNTPAVIVIDCKGMSDSIGAIMKGFLTFRTPNNICGFIFNRLPESIEPAVKTLCRKLETEYLGRMPYDKYCSFESRRLGLVTADEISDIKNKIKKLSEYAEKFIDIERLVEISANAKKNDVSALIIPDMCSADPIKIAVAYDSAFCFLYEDNIELLKEMGCEIVKFSPLNDKILPDEISGMILCGGYPELYLSNLSDNIEMLCRIKKSIESRIPVIAECGGFMYLHNAIRSESGELFKMVGVVDAIAYKTEKLQRFGYTYLTAENDNMLCEKSEKIKAHEFHYWDSSDCGSDFTAEKARNNEIRKAIFADMNSYMGYPHLYFYSNIKTAENFVKACLKYRRAHEKDKNDNRNRQIGGAESVGTME